MPSMDTAEWRLKCAVLYGVPPWVLYDDYPRPRFSQLRWRLRGIWPLKPADGRAPLLDALRSRPVDYSGVPDLAAPDHLDEKWPDGSGPLGF